MSLASGTRIGVYEVAALIGAGGMGEVYRARDTRLNRDVALKVLPELFSRDTQRMARFEREAKLLASLNHPNIAAIYGLEESGPVRGLVMELVDGPTLADRIRGGPIPLDEALPIAKQIADALEYAHDKNVIHRDLKPANIKLTTDGAVKVLDFGLAKAMSEESGEGDMSNSPTLSMAATRQGVILGTVAYMSPEQAKGKSVDRRTDVWAFGCVLYEILTGQQTFQGEDITEVLASVVKSEPAFETLPTNTPLPIRHLLRRCLEKNLRRRLGHISEARIILEDVLSGVVPVEQPTAHSQKGRERMAWSVAAALFVAAVAALAVGGFAYFRRAPNRPDSLVRFSVAPPAESIRPVGAAFAVSPDGQNFAFTSEGANRVPQIFIRRIDSANAQPLAETDNASGVFWSPDSRSLAFVKEGVLYRSNLGADPPKRLCDIPNTVFRGGTWSSSGVIVFGANAGGLFRVPDTGGAPVPVTTLDAAAKEVGHFGPWFLPDGRHLLFLALPGGNTRGIIWATSIDDPKRTRIVESSGSAAYAAGWLLTSTETPRSLVAQPFDAERLTLMGTSQPVRDGLPSATTAGGRGFSVSASGTLVVDRPPPVSSQLTWMDRTGRAVGTVGPRASINDFALAPDERRVVMGVQDNDSGRRALWLFDGLRENGTQLTYEGRPTRPMWALDGRHIYFTFGSTTSANVTLSTIAIGAAVPVAFENPGQFIHFEDVTKDGRYLVFKSINLPIEVWIQAVGSAERRALVKGPFSATRPRVSPDSRWLAYTLTLPSGDEVFVQPFDRSGDRIQVSAKGGFGPIWRDDGRELYYESPEGLMAVTMTERGDALEVGTSQKLFAIHTQGNVTNQPHNVEVAAHGQKFMVNTIVGESDNVPLEVTLNWTAGLKK
jgi:serine/threonine protein kinase/dipeptidyl aminopeptidase/acylaminoacyl peptidase